MHFIFSNTLQALSEQVVLEDESIPSLDLEINAKEGTTESLYLVVPIQGIIPEKSLFIHRRLQGKTYNYVLLKLIQKLIINTC